MVVLCPFYKRGYGSCECISLTSDSAGQSWGITNDMQIFLSNDFLSSFSNHGHAAKRLRKLHGSVGRIRFWIDSNRFGETTKFHHIWSQYCILIVFHHQRRLGNQEECIGIQYNWFIHHFYLLEYLHQSAKHKMVATKTRSQHHHIDSFKQCKHFGHDIFVHIRIHFSIGFRKFFQRNFSHFVAYGFGSMGSFLQIRMDHKVW